LTWVSSSSAVSASIDFLTRISCATGCGGSVTVAFRASTTPTSPYLAHSLSSSIRFLLRRHTAGARAIARSADRPSRPTRALPPKNNSHPRLGCVKQFTRLTATLNTIGQVSDARVIRVQTRPAKEVGSHLAKRNRNRRYNTAMARSLLSQIGTIADRGLSPVDFGCMAASGIDLRTYEATYRPPLGIPLSQDGNPRIDVSVNMVEWLANIVE
jgi:hypothetical protein